MHEMTDPLVSVIIPIFNGEKYIEQTIDSVLSQTYQNWELIIINDGSSDNTERLILKYPDKRIRYLRNDTNRGISPSLNRGIDEAKGEFIARLDADDIALPLRFEKQVEFLSKNRDYALCGSYFQTIDSAGNILKHVRFPNNDRDAQSYLLLHNCFCQSSIMMKAEIAKELKYDHRFRICEDYDLWYRISKLGKIINLPLFTTLYRIHDLNITRKSEIMFKDVNIVNRKIMDDLGIEYTEKEFELHTNALSYHADYFSNSGNLRLLENWINKLYKYIRESTNYNALLCYRILTEKWIVLAYKSGNLKSVFFNHLILKHPSVYLNNLFAKAIK
jgi:glycosyltransferase involved in cell wall biosynthesis